MNDNAVISEFQKASSLHGVLTRVAERLKVSPQHVREVALGKRTSKRVMQAVKSEFMKARRSLERAA